VTTNYQEIFRNPPPARQRLDRRWRAGLWFVASCLKSGGVLAVFVIAIQTSWWGVIALAAVISGFLLAFVLEATSRGD
jgi:hypothetical protein